MYGGPDSDWNEYGQPKYKLPDIPPGLTERDVAEMYALSGGMNVDALNRPSHSPLVAYVIGGRSEKIWEHERAVRLWKEYHGKSPNP